MSLESIVTQFGYPALVAGLLLEGETMLVLGAFMAHRGYLSLPLVIIIGWLVAFASDQFFFWLGRTRGTQFLAQRPAWESPVEKAKTLLKKNSTLLFVGLRFMYGLRTVLPFVIGMSKQDVKKFALLDFVGACLWSLTFSLTGHLLSQLMAAVLEDVKENETTIAIAILVIGSAIWFYRRYKNKSSETKHP